jgi:hypothetical protein
LTSATATGPFSFASVYGTNSATAGRIAQNGATVIGWLPGATMFYEVAGWSANFGVTFNPAWPTWTPNQFPVHGYFGLSAIANGVAGGPDGGIPAPAWKLFGGTGLPGLNLNPVGVPEPTGMALAGLAAATLLVFHRRSIRCSRGI